MNKKIKKYIYKITEDQIESELIIRKEIRKASYSDEVIITGKRKLEFVSNSDIYEMQKSWENWKMSNQHYLFPKYFYFVFVDGKLNGVFTTYRSANGGKGWNPEFQEDYEPNPYDGTY